MGLGELYIPKNKALETAQAVLEIEEPYAVNIALGCSNGCLFCYGPKMMRQSREQWMKIRHPKVAPGILVAKQLNRWMKEDPPRVPEGVFMSFLTDPFLPKNRTDTERLIKQLLLRGIRGIQTATLSKVGTSGIKGVRHGMTINSIDSSFWEKWEPRTTPPLKRIILLEALNKVGEFTWASMEPIPCWSIWKQKIEDVLERLTFLDLIVAGVWNYDKRATTMKARRDYTRIFEAIRDFCRSNVIRLHIKKETKEFLKRG